MNRQTKKRIGIAVVLLSIAAWLIIRSSNHAADAENAIRDNKAAEDKMIAVLPVGVEEAWVNYVDQRLERSFQVRSNSVLLKSWLGMLPYQLKMVSLNTPYTIECSWITGGSITFGFGEEAISIPIFGIMTGHKDSEPALGVSALSVAANNLNALLCDRIERTVAKMVERRE